MAFSYNYFKKLNCYEKRRAYGHNVSAHQVAASQ